MREVLLVSISALLGYIIFSAFSTTDTPSDALRKIIEQPQADMQQKQELAFNQLSNDKETKLIELQNQDRLNELNTYQNIKINEKENNTKVELKEIDYKITHDVATMKMKTAAEQKSKDNATFIVIAFLMFLLIYIYLKYQKQLSQIELEKENNFNEMLARKEYAEKILTLLSTGNISFETEQKLLKVLDELNGQTLDNRETEIIYHPNPDIAQLSSKIVS